MGSPNDDSHQADEDRSWELIDDGINYLMAGDVAAAIGLNEQRGKRKRFGVPQWTSPQQVFTWPVTARNAGECELSIQVKAPAGTALRVSSSTQSMTVVTTADDWQRLNTSLVIATGMDRIELALTETVTEAALFSVEVITAQHLPVHQQRLATLKEQRGSVDWFQDAGFGIMFQWGSWGYPKTGNRKQPWQCIYREFDIAAFADRMQRLNPGYVIWSITWRGSRFSAPLKSVAAIMGSTD